MSVLENLDQLVTQANAEVEQLEQQKLAIDAQLRRLRAFVRAVNPSVPTRPKPAAKPSSVGSDAQMTMIRAILKSKEPFTALGIHASAMDLSGRTWSEPHTYQALKVLREKGLIGKAGKTPRDAGPQRDLYRILEEDTMRAMVSDNG